jgi:hypothetical protein
VEVSLLTSLARTITEQYHAADGRSVTGFSPVRGQMACCFWCGWLFSGNDTFTVQLSNKDWNLVKGNKYDITMRFDQNRLWSAQGVGFVCGNGDPGIEYIVRRQELHEFIKDFGSSSGLVLHLPNSRVPDWTIDLTGVKAVNDEFENCNRNLK